MPSRAHNEQSLAMDYYQLTGCDPGEPTEAEAEMEFQRRDSEEAPMPIATPPSKFHFDAESHTYWYDGCRLPSVTQVLRYVVPHYEADQWYLDRGTAVHHGCRLLDEGRLDWSTVDAEIEPRLRAWQAACKQLGLKHHYIEEPLWHSRYRYAGTIDRLSETAAGVPLVIDLKNSIDPSVELQLGAYAMLVPKVDARRLHAAAVHLKEDGTYALRWLQAREVDRAGQTFLGCLSVYNWMRKNNVKGGR